MMKKIILIFFLVIVSSCTLENEQVIEERVPILFSVLTSNDSGEERVVKSNEKIIYSEVSNDMEITMSESEWEPKVMPITKTSWGTTTNTVNWLVGDSIGVYLRRFNGVPDANIDRSNILHTTVTATAVSNLVTSVIPPLYYPYSTTDNVNIYAYYPYNKFSTPNVSPVVFPTAASQFNDTLSYSIPDNQTITNQCDLLYVRRTGLTKNSTSPVTLTFNHALVLMTFAIISSNHAGQTVTKVKLDGNKVTRTGTVYLDAANVVESPSTTFVPYVNTNFVLSSTTAKYVDIIINPCSVGGNGSTKEMELTITVNGVDHSARVAKNSTLARARRYNTNVTVL